jgi:hypothetical protein
MSTKAPLFYCDFKDNKLICTDSEMLSFLHEVYNGQRYLIKISNDSLLKRLKHLIINLVELDFYGDKSFIINQGETAIALIDVFGEFNLRKVDYTPLVQKVLSLFEEHKRFKNYQVIVNKIKDCAGKKCLFKFTKKEYLDSLIRGEIRLKLASLYNDDGFNIAIRDDELTIVHQLLNSRIITKDGVEIPIKDDIIRSSTSGDYYVGCFSINIDPKLFLMFEADACLIIKNGDIFSQEVINRYQDNYKDSTILFGPVEYIDPYRRLKLKKIIEFVKIIDFKYENEFRFVAFDFPWIKKEEVRIITIDMKNIDYDIIEI